MNNDLISREALREDFYELEIHGTMAVKAVLPIIEERIDNLPAVDAVEVVHAKWEKFGIDYKHEASLYECSACGKIVRKYWEDERFECCPYCGARMDGDGNGKA